MPIIKSRKFYQKNIPEKKKLKEIKEFDHLRR
jgi:hypothetical protein